MADLFGALSNRGIILSIKFYRKLHISLPLRVALAGFISGIIVAMLPQFFRDNTVLRKSLIITGSHPSVAAIASGVESTVILVRGAIQK